MKTKTFRFFSATLIMLSIVFIISCSDNNDDTTSATLYTRLGGIDAIAAVTDQFLANVAADSKINARFEATVANSSRLQLLRNNLIDQICAGAGGPCQYKGKTMLAAHTGMNITQDEFNALVGDLVAALDKFNVPEKEKNDLLAILGPMQSDIVGK
ncbi:MAG TPA: group 1 truncated hemoglobin [Ohtaekwangia sp.]|uniref:group I truncated hemoglobin n=1 Tax=Ohtaekwangia sp. TaxID=2066019 RepID=UPI002F922592